MILSIICPTLNEINYIENLVKSIAQNDGIEKEIFFVDAGSTDGTKEKINELSKIYTNIRLVDNPQKYVSQGFNKAFPLTSGKYITLIGAHSKYPENFFKNGIYYLENGEADVVGGPLKQKGKTETGEVIARCMSSKFGVGNTEFRTSSEKMYVDSVAFAIYKREIFEKTGLLDEELIRNQDDELHYRINSYKYKILMVPEMQCEYYVRGSIGKLFSQYYQYGLFKPLVLKKVKSGIRLRHLIPTFFVIYLFLLGFLLKLSGIFVVPFLLYMSINIYISVRSESSVKNILTSMLVFITLHFSYGSGFIVGLKKII